MRLIEDKAKGFNVGVKCQTGGTPDAFVRSIKTSQARFEIHQIHYNGQPETPSQIFVF